MSEEVCVKAFSSLFPNRNIPNMRIVYGSLHGFNARVYLSFNNLKIHMSKKWKDVGEDIKIGCIQELLLKVYKIKKKPKTIEIELYNNFIRSLSDCLPKIRSHPVLEESFNRINKEFFDEELSQTNLKLGKGINLLGSFCYQTNTISISSMLLDHPDLLDFVMYHEMLHKKHKFYSTKTGRSIHHSCRFRKDEKSYPDADILEKKLGTLISSTKRSVRRRKSLFSRFFG